MRGDMVLDTSVLVEILLATTTGEELVDAMIAGELQAYTTTLNITEAMYVLCRLLGMEEAKRRVRMLLDSNCLHVVSSDKVSEDAAECKCMFPISLVDCHTLALAKRYGMPALFYQLEKEFKPILKQLKEWTGADILFVVREG